MPPPRIRPPDPDIGTDSRPGHQRPGGQRLRRRTQRGRVRRCQAEGNSALRQAPDQVQTGQAQTGQRRKGPPRTCHARQPESGNQSRAIRICGRRSPDRHQSGEGEPTYRQPTYQPPRSNRPRTKQPGTCPCRYSSSHLPKAPAQAGPAQRPRSRTALPTAGRGARARARAGSQGKAPRGCPPRGVPPQARFSSRLSCCCTSADLRPWLS